MSDNIVRISDYLDRPSVPPVDDGHLKPGGDGGNSNGMDPWQQTVESRLGELRADTGRLKTDVAVLVERVSHLPTKGFIVSALLTILAILAALSLFGPNLRAALGIH